MKPIKITKKWTVPSWNTRKLFADDDRDGVANVFDCQPRNPRRQDGGWGNASDNEKKFERFQDEKKTDSNITKITKNFKTRRY